MKKESKHFPVAEVIPNENLWLILRDDLGIIQDSLNIRVHRGDFGKKIGAKTVVLISTIIGFLAISSMAIVGFLALTKNKLEEREK